MFNKTRRKVVIVVLLLITPIVICILFQSSGNGEEQAQREPTKQTTTIDRKTSKEHAFQFLKGAFDSEKVSGDLRRAQIIQNIRLEKDSICANEDLRVDVDVKEDQISANLVISIDGISANPAVVNYSEPGVQEILVVARNFSRNVIDQRRISVEVFACEFRPAITFSAKHKYDNSDEIVFEIDYMNNLSKDCIYEWDFGDGKMTTSKSKIISNSYRMRAQNSYMSSYLVSLKATDMEGNQATFRKTVTLLNIHYLSKAMGRPVLSTIYERFPKRDVHGIQTTIGFGNLLDENVNLNTARLRFKSCNRSTATIKKEVMADRLLASTQIPLGTQSSTDLTLSDSMIPDSTCSVAVEFIGSSREYQQVIANVFLDLPPQSVERSERMGMEVVRDTSIIKKLNKASALFGKNILTEDEVNRLKKEGRF